MNKATQFVIGASVIGASLVTAVAASAYWGGRGMELSADEAAVRHQEMMEEKAELLGVDAEVVKQAWAEGKTLHDLALEQGWSEDDLQQKMRESKQERAQEMLGSMVQNGTITQEQADLRLERMSEHEGERMMHRGEGRKGHGLRF